MGNPELLACPFCGGVDLHVDASESWPSFVACNSCLSYGPSFDDGENQSVARLESGAIAAWNRRTASPAAPANLDPLRSLTPEELAAFKPISDEQIDEALMKGARARWQAEHPAVSTAGAAPTPPSEPCPNCESTTGCDCSPDDVLGAVVEQHPIPSSRTPGMSVASATTEGPRGETPGRAKKPGGTR